MRKICSILLMILLPAFMVSPLTAAVNVAGSSTGCLLANQSGADVHANLPLTIAAWVKLTTTGSDSQTVAEPSSYTLSSVDNGDCGSKVVAFVKLGKAGICSSHTPSTTAWEFEAAVVNAGNTSVHFFFMTASGTVTTQNVADSNSFNSTGGSPIGGSYQAASCANPLQGSIAQAAIWAGQSLSDAELTAYARNGPLAIGRIPAFYWPLFFSNAAGVVMGDYDPSTFNTGGNRYHLLNLRAGGTVNTSNHCVCGDPF